MLVQRHNFVLRRVAVGDERDMKIPSQISSSDVIFVWRSINVSHLVHRVHLRTQQFPLLKGSPAFVSLIWAKCWVTSEVVITIERGCLAVLAARTCPRGQLQWQICAKCWWNVDSMGKFGYSDRYISIYHLSMTGFASWFEPEASSREVCIFCVYLD